MWVCVDQRGSSPCGKCKSVIWPPLVSQVLNSFRSEVSILAQLRHPNVVLYIGACTRPPNVFIVTEWCERGGLNDLLYDASIPLSSARRVNFALQAARGMCYLHRCGVDLRMALSRLKLCPLVWLPRLG